MGRPVSPAELAGFAELQELIKPAAALKRIEDFAKWTFATASVVGTLGAAVGLAGWGPVQGLGRLVFAVSVASLGLSLACATLALTPRWQSVNPNSRDSLLAALGLQFHRRRWQLRVGSSCFAIALVLAALAPLASTAFPRLTQPRISTSYDLKVGGDLSVEASATGLPADGSLAVELRTKQPSTRPLPRARKGAGTDGTAKVALALKDPEVLAAGFEIITTQFRGTGKDREDVLSIPSSVH